MIKRILLITIIYIFQIYAGDSPFTFIYVDGKTENKIGIFPYSRDIYAKAIRIASKNGAKAVVLKYFIDETKYKETDTELSKSFSEIPVFLQCRLNINQENPNILPDRFLSSDVIINKSQNILSGDSGWMPFEILSEKCYDIGFVDIYNHRNNHCCPVIGLYRNIPIKSLPIKIFEFLYSEEIKIENRMMVFRGNSYKLTPEFEYKFTFPDKDRLKKYSLADLLEDKIDRIKLSGKIVILGYDGDNQAVIQTPIGGLKAHDYFGYVLLAMYDDFK